MIKKVEQKTIQIYFLFLLGCFFCGCSHGVGVRDDREVITDKEVRADREDRPVREKITKFNPLKQLNPENYPEFVDNLNFRDFTISIDNSLKYFKKVPQSRKYQYGEQSFNAAHMITSLKIFKAFIETNPSAKALNKFIKSKFIVFKATGNKDEKVLFTGYFEPSYNGSLQRTDLYKYPVYSVPNDLLKIDLSRFSNKYKGHKSLVARLDDSGKTILPYYSREQINMMKDFHKKAEPLVWLKDRVDRFFLEIQGSGRIILENQDELKVHYAKSNGNAYRSIGRYLIDNDKILKKNMSMQAIRKWLKYNADSMDKVLHYNKSFVFFQKEEGGPYGCLGVEVTALRSIATDTGLFPKGALGFMETKLPDKTKIHSSKEWGKTSFFVLNQDTGGAIKGPARADLFCGNGEYARLTAGHMNQYGKLFFLVLKPVNSL